MYSTCFSQCAYDFLNNESIEVLKPVKYDVEKAGKCLLEMILAMKIWILNVPCRKRRQSEWWNILNSLISQFSGHALMVLPSLRNFQSQNYISKVIPTFFRVKLFPGLECSRGWCLSCSKEPRDRGWILSCESRVGGLGVYGVFVCYFLVGWNQYDRFQDVGICVLCMQAITHIYMKDTHTHTSDAHAYVTRRMLDFPCVSFDRKFAKATSDCSRRARKH